MKLPFRLGTTSWIYRAGWLANVERLAGRVDDIEILFFDISRLEDRPTEEELRGLTAWKARAGLTYTLHTPIGVRLASANKDLRHHSVETVRRAIDVSRCLEPDLFVVHIELESADCSAWRDRATRSLEELLEENIAPEAVCVEVLDYDFALVEPVLGRLGLSVALDVGHLLRDGRLLEGIVERNLHRTRIIHWHGVDRSGRDHRSLAHFPVDQARWFLDQLYAHDYRGVLTIEVFGEEEFEESLATFESLLSEVAK